MEAWVPNPGTVIFETLDKVSHISKLGLTYLTGIPLS